MLDDLHWSDEPSLLALEFVSKHALTVPLLLVGTYREDEAGEALLRLASGARIIELSGLAATDIAVLMTDLTGRVPGERLANEVWSRTNGNPFLAREVTRLLAANTEDWAGIGTLTDVPTGVRAVLDARLSALSAPCLTALRTAAVAGRDVDVAVLADALGWSSGDTVECLEEAVRRRVRRAYRRRPEGRYRFVHDLFRDTAYDGLTPADAGARHLAVGRAPGAITRRGIASGRGRAGHPLRGRRHADRRLAGGAAQRGHLCHRAAQEAAARLADEDACAEYERALGFAVDADTRLELLLALGHAQYRCGRAAAARGSFRSAADLARERKDPDGLARAALGWHRVGVRSGTADRRGVALLDEALALLGDDAGPVAAAAAGRPGPQPAPAAPVRDPASRGRCRTRAPIPIAGRQSRSRATHGDPAVLASCLLALHDALWRPGSARERLPIVAEMAALAQQCGDRELFAQARQLRAAMLLELGDPDGIDELADYCRLADELGHQRARWSAMTRRATLATLLGDLDEAQHLSEAALELGLRHRRARCLRRRRHAELRAGPAWRCRLSRSTGDPSELEAVGPQRRAVAAGAHRPAGRRP